MGGAPKQFRLLGAAPVVVHAARAALAHPAVQALVVAVPQGEVDVVDAMLRSFGLGDEVELRVVEGGASRQASVANAVEATPAGADVLLVHDAARPFLPAGRLAAVLETAAAAGAAALAVPVTDTLRAARQGETTGTVDRTGLWLMQTPQAARRALLRGALESASREGFEGTDEVALLERAGVGVRLVEGDARNFKLTSDGDWAMAEALVRVKGEG
jgi:2-C-methyl-D-erythritol 4-phosphate cytidylyltransferase